MARLKRDAPARQQPARERLRVRVVAALEDLEARRRARDEAVADGDGLDRWVMVDYVLAVGERWLRRRLEALDSGWPVIVARWELASLGITEVPSLAWSYVIHPDGRVEAHGPEPVADRGRKQK